MVIMICLVDLVNLGVVMGTPIPRPTHILFLAAGSDLLGGALGRGARSCISAKVLMTAIMGVHEPQSQRPVRQRLSVEDKGNLPWMQPPTWLYLPHLGIGCGELVTSSTAIDTVDGGGIENHVATLAHGGTSSDGGPQRRLIRGRVEPALQPPGPERHGYSPAAARDVEQIRGRPAPGTTGERGTARARAEARLAAQHAPLRRSLDDHADRVAKRQRCGDPPGQPPLAARLAALRARVVARAEQAGSAASGSNDAANLASNGAAVGFAVAHAATRAAHHGVASVLAD